MNIKKFKLNPTQIYVLKIFGVVLAVIIALTIIILSIIFQNSSVDNKNDSNSSSTKSDLISTSTSIYTKIEPGIVEDFPEIFPYITEEYAIYLNASKNEMEVYSQIYSVVELQKKIEAWIENFPSVSYDEYSWQYFGKEDITQERPVTEELINIQNEGL